MPRPDARDTRRMVSEKLYDPFAMHRIAATLGISAVGLFGVALVVFAGLNPHFNYVEDYVSKLGALGQPHALWWNFIGFFAVGVLLAAFGLVYGRLIGDRAVGVLLTLFGIGFAATAIPVDTGDETSSMSKAHVVAICLGLAAWFLALAGWPMGRGTARLHT